MTEPQEQQKAPQAVQDEIDDFLKELNEDFGKKPAGAKELNRKFHKANPELSKSMGKAPEDPMYHWVPQARITYVTTQHCKSCGDKVSFIGGEYVRFISSRQHAVITRRTDQCSDLWHYGWNADEEIQDLVDELHQEVTRCAGCIKVEKQALEIWDTAQRGETPQDDLPGLDKLLDGGGK